MDVVEYLARVEEPARLTDISKAIHLPKSQVHRLLATLASRGFIQQDPDTQRYFLGVNTWLLGQHVSLGYPLLRISRPVLDQITLDETIYLAILDKVKTLYLYIRYGAHPIQAVVPLGGNGPLHATATGKAMLAFQNQDFISAFLKSPLQKFTPKTITEPNILFHELTEIRARGYSVAVDELAVDFCGIAVPILDDRDCSIAALGISAPSSRFTEENSAKMIAIATDVTQEIQQRLGFFKNRLVK